MNSGALINKTGASFYEWVIESVIKLIRSETLTDSGRLCIAL